MWLEVGGLTNDNPSTFCHHRSIERPSLPPFPHLHRYPRHRSFLVAAHIVHTPDPRQLRTAAICTKNTKKIPANSGRCDDMKQVRSSSVCGLGIIVGYVIAIGDAHSLSNILFSRSPR